MKDEKLSPQDQFANELDMLINRSFEEGIPIVDIILCLDMKKVSLQFQGLLALENSNNNDNEDGCCEDGECDC